MTTNPKRCTLSGARVNISVADESNRRTRCPGPNGCGRMLRIRPSRIHTSSRVGVHFAEGYPAATLPTHNKE